MTLSKSDFKIASSCPKKLIYKKASYLTKNDSNEYMEMLAQGGYIVGKYAQLTYPDGIEVSGETLETAIEETKRLLDQKESVTLFEATVISNNKIIRIDILEKKGNVLNLIEVKSKSFDSAANRVKELKDLRESIKDVAYQTMVLKEVYPDFEINSYLLLPDKAKKTEIEGLAGWFRVDEMIEEKFEIDVLPAQNIIQFKKPRVQFKYENYPNKQLYINHLVKDNLLTLVGVNDEVDLIMDYIKHISNIFLEILENGIMSGDFSIDKKCKQCEFNLGIELNKNGYHECWKELSGVDPHIFDLFKGGTIKSAENGYYWNELINQRRVSFLDLDIERFKDNNGALSQRGQRQLIQFQNTKANSEWISEELGNELKKLKYPLHFIDFETYTGVIPHHIRMRPYELIAFQWSCHTLTAPDAEPTHSEWLNCEYDFPNFRFAESLMDQIGDSGTPLMWSPFENSILRGILVQMEIFSYSNDLLKQWLISIITGEDRKGRFADMNLLTLNYYFHPQMKGKTSIKKVLPAIWNNNTYLHSIPWFRKYASSDSLEVINPYDTLAPVISELEKEEVVNDGTGAMRAYHELMFGTLANDFKRKEQLKKLLLQYCELDTMAMVIVWRYWMDRCEWMKL
ncbi:MAG: DUF2779 domain-containing protein [bacterium]